MKSRVRLLLSSAFEILARRVRASTAPVDVVLYTKPGCHLCDEMKRVLGRAKQGLEVRVEEIDISSQQQLSERYGEEIPVLFINGRKAYKYRASEEDLRRRLLRAETRPNSR